MDVAKATGIDTGNLSRIENGTMKSLAKAESLVQYFGTAHISELEILYPERYGFQRETPVEKVA